MSEQENITAVPAPVVFEKDEETPSVVHTIDKEAVLEAERVMKEGIPQIEEAAAKIYNNVRKTFFQSNLIRLGVVIVAVKVVTITGNIISEQLRENRKNKNDEK